MSIHSQNDEVILQFGLHKPAYRIVVNTPTTHGSIGLTTGLDPAMTLGCGGFGGNITSDNISPLHLLNVKRVAYELTPAQSDAPAASGEAASEKAATPASPATSAGAGVSTEALRSRIEAFLASRGVTRGAVLAAAGGGAAAAPPAVPPASTVQTAGQPAAEANSAPKSNSPDPAPAQPVPFVCEDDVRQALRGGRTIEVTERTIITPAARDLGDEHGIFVRR
jgi:hypothetical protein